MKDFEKVQEVKRAVQGRLLAIPGVHAVAVGPKIVGGKRTNDMSIMVYLIKKKPLAELRPEEVIPVEIDGVKTDVIESGVFRLRADDNSRYRPLVGGCMITPGGYTPGVTMGNPAASVLGTGLGGSGTLGCFASTGGPSPKVVAITCWHVVAIPPRGQQLTLTVNDTFTFGGTNTSGTIVAVNATVGGVNAHAFHETGDSDTLQDIATAVASKLNLLGFSGFQAVPSGAQILFNGLNQATDKLACAIYSAHAPNTWADIVTATRGNTISSIRGLATRASGAYVNVNTGGPNPTSGVFVPIAKGINSVSVIKSIGDAIHDASIPSIAPNSTVTATVAGATVTLAATQEIECDVSSDVRVGQPTNTMCVVSCLNDRIGLILDAHVDTDAALIQLDSGQKYRADILDTDPSGSSPGSVKGTHDLTDADLDIGLRLKKRGFRTGLTRGILQALDTSGYAIYPDSNTPPEWKILARFYEHAFTIDGASFADGGDSGSAVLNADNDVVGILFGSSDTAAVATHISKVFESFKSYNLAIETAAQPGIDKVAP